MENCSIASCPSPVNARGWCRKHYKRWLAHGDPEYTVSCPRDLTLWEKVEWHGWATRQVRDGLTPCWEFPTRNSQGYGRISQSRQSKSVHRISFEHFHRPLDSEEVVRHRCDNPPCLNPEHLTAGTVADNVRDMDLRGRRNPSRGQDHPGSRFTQVQVDEMRTLNKNYGVSQERLSILLGVSQSTISKIVSGNRWKESYNDD